MSRRTATLAAALTGLLVFHGAAAFRVIQQSEDAYEAVLVNVSLPASDSGNISLRSCSDCESHRLAVSTATAYRLNGQPLTLASLRQEVARIRTSNSGAERTAVYVYFDTGSGRVSRVVVDQL